MKISNIYKLSMLAFLSIAVASCGNRASTTPTSTPSEKTTTVEIDKEYAVSFKNENYISITTEGLKENKATAGSTISFSLNLTDDSKELISVYLDSIELFDDNGSYSFTMPNHNVDVTINTEEKGGDENTKNVSNVNVDSLPSSILDLQSYFEKALDTELTIISSSDNSVTSIDSYDIVKSKNIGKTILTIQSKSGIQKQLEVTVVIPSISKIEINSYNPFYFTDTDYNIHLNIDPDNTPYEIEVTSDKPELVTITPEDDYWYKLNFKEKGTYNITAKSKSNPTVSCTKEFEVQGSKKTDEEIKASVVGTWKADLMDANGINTIKDAVTVIFNEDKTGTLTFNSDKTGYTFELNKPYEFTYDFTTSSYNDRPIKVTMSSIILDHGAVTWTYDKNYAEFYQTGEDSLNTFSSTNNNEYGAEVQLKAKRQ